MNVYSIYLILLPFTLRNLAENIRDAVRETHDKVDDILGRFEAAAIRHPPPQEEQYSPSVSLKEYNV